MESENRARLVAGLRNVGVEPEAAALDAVQRHLAMVAEWNERINLTAIRDEREMVLKHAVDSAAAAGMIQFQPGMRVLDVGSGAGFPGVTLKCLFPGIRLVLLDSLGKRCKFLEAVGHEVIATRGGLDGYEVLWGRAEDLGQDKRYREQFDVVVARAVAELRVLSEFCLPFCRVGGEFLAMKGPAAGEELAAAGNAIRTLGGEVAEVREVTLPEDAGTRTLIRIRKVSPTPKAYPRRAGVPAKSPL
jgi:16S rRNA (guanine527-N7)-methyltransferase